MSAGEGRKTPLDYAFHAVEALLVLILAAMVVLVFGNVVMRYVFDSGIIVSEELSRFMFVWVSFLGAVSVMHRHGHLGVDMFVAVLPAIGRRVCRIISGVLMLACCVLLGVGAYDQTMLNLDNHSPISGLPTAWSYGAALVSAIGIGVLVLADLYQAVVTGEEPPRGEVLEP